MPRDDVVEVMKFLFYFLNLNICGEKIIMGGKSRGKKLKLQMLCN